MFCPNCGTNNSDDAIFCGGCGNPLTNANSIEDEKTMVMDNQAPVAPVYNPPVVEQPVAPVYTPPVYTPPVEPQKPKKNTHSPAPNVKQVLVTPALNVSLIKA